MGTIITFATPHLHHVACSECPSSPQPYYTAIRGRTALWFVENWRVEWVESICCFCGKYLPLLLCCITHAQPFCLHHAFAYILYSEWGLIEFDSIMNNCGRACVCMYMCECDAAVLAHTSFCYLFLIVSFANFAHARGVVGDVMRWLMGLLVAAL